MGVGAKISVVMFDDDELTVTAKSCAAINHFPCRRGGYRLPRLARNIDALGAFGKSFQHFTFGRPDPFDPVITSRGFRAPKEPG